MTSARHKGWAVALTVFVLLWIAPMALAQERASDTSSSRNLNVASTSKRIALVIGNDDYQKVSKLEKAGNDAKAMARELKAAGFDVLLHRDLNFHAMVKAVDTFADRITGGDQVVVFFAGHGVQIKTGSYLLPVDIEANNESQVEKTAYALADLTDKLSEAKASFALVMVDACRDNPLKSKGRSIGNNRGLSAIEPPKGQMVVYSASKGQQALDRLNENDNNPNGVFTREFIKRMKQPGVRIEDLMREVQDSVETLAQSIGHDQRPAVYNEARGNFYFFGPTTIQVQGQSQSAMIDPETQTWLAAERVNSIESYQGYLDAYPKGRYAPAAKIAMAGLKPATVRPTATPLPTKPNPVASDDPDTALWKAVESSNTTEDYAVYLKQYPKGKYVAQAKQRSKKLDDVARVEAEAGEKSEWQAAERASTVDAYQAYIARYPKGKYSALAQTRANKLKNDIQIQAEVRIWENARSSNSADAFDDYLSRYPNGRYAALVKVAQQRLQREAADQSQKEAARQQRLQREAEDRRQQEVARQQNEQREAAQLGEQDTWRQAESATDSATVQRYLDRYPSGPHAEQARTQLAMVKKAEAETRPRKVFKDCADCPEMVVIPAGSFEMGNNDVRNEKSIHRVNIKSFSLGKYEVTQGQWKAVMGSNPSNFKECGDSCPVERVSWDDIQEYIQKLNVKSGQQYRLPSESEWEYAARAGTSTQYWWGDKASHEYANYGKDNCCEGLAQGRDKWENTAPVGQFQANGYGLHDMHGNVWEWVQDCWHENYKGAPEDGSAWTSSCSDRELVLRGGGWNRSPLYLRSAHRNLVTPDYRDGVIGFRLARTLPTP